MEIWNRKASGKGLVTVIGTVSLFIDHIATKFWAGYFSQCSVNLFNQYL